MLYSLEPFIEKHFDTRIIKTKHVGGGFYGLVYYLEIDKEPFNLIVKFYLTDNLAIREKKQLEILTKHSLIRMPEVYLLYKKSGNIYNDFIIMEHIKGVNAGMKDVAENKEFIADKVIDNLIHLHSVTNNKGFGELDGEEYYSDFRDWYRIRVDEIIDNAASLYEQHKLNTETYKILLDARDNFDKIFYLPITKPGLVHGDYNMWNIMLTEEMDDVIAVIDPYNCCWSDPEFDLYQLNNANGKEYGLLDNYRSKVKLSDNFELKMIFYEVFTEVKHYHDAGVEPDGYINNRAVKLKNKMTEEGIVKTRDH